ncbi:HNH endonuclease signature motif containing protein [Streptomyces sp. AC495_CC817]|uniref:HNH endonuclease signature motif containing protein n=1 Tax=Streptomyces sp. AC495_CC817 TaxID=2823900 RepID=UPI001C270B43|nr:HNH endonuclease signature motif containing protein [Streptomyces sp. AC495_CC817]
MEALLDATDDQMALLADLVESLSVADATVNAMMAARDGLLALAGRLAVDIAAQGDHPDRGDMTTRTVAAEIGQALRVSDRTVERRMGQASVLVDAFPTVWQAQGAGRISAAHAHVVIEAGSGLTDPAERAAYAAAVLPLAEEESPNRLRPLAKRIAERLRGSSIDERHKAARQRRRVWAVDADDAMADLHLHGPAVLVHAMTDRLAQMAHTIRTENRREAADAARSGIPFEPDTRSIDELRADLLADLVLTGVPTAHDSADGLLGSISARVTLTVPVLTLMTADGSPGSAESSLGLGNPANAHEGTTSTHNGQASAHEGPTSNHDGQTSTHDGRASTHEGTPRLCGDPAGVHGAPTTGTASREAPPKNRDAQQLVTATPSRPTHSGEASSHQRASLPPASLDGVIPVDASTARMLAAHATGWDRALTHPITGSLLAVDRYRPSEELRRHLRTRDERCRFPTCGLSARRCDVDHNQAAASGGETSADNLSTFCRRHHMLKHHSPWQVAHHAGGVLEWTSPTGRSYVDRPPAPHTVVFAPPAEPWTTADDLLNAAHAPF